MTVSCLGWAGLGRTGRAASRRCRTLSWSVWPWRSSCWAWPVSGTGSATPERIWSACSRGCPASPGFGKRLRAAGPLIAAVITELASDIDSWHDLLRLVDSTPLPCAASRERVTRSDLAGRAGYGYCPSHSRYFWGFRLYLICTAEGMPIIWGLANPKLGEREVTQALLEAEHHLIRDGQVILGDKGFAGREFEAFLQDRLGAHFVRPDRKHEPARHGTLARCRQWI